MMTVPPLDQGRLLTMAPAQLEALYRSSPAGGVPNGNARGAAIVAPGVSYSKDIAELVHILVWQGKTFDAARGRVVNRVTSLGIEAVPAEVYLGPSRLDGKACVVIDYSRTSSIARWVRDEIRLVAPNLYLGYAFAGPVRIVAFSLAFTVN
jgi:hypothetical protein